MSQNVIEWKKGIVWDARVKSVIGYIQTRKLKYGPKCPNNPDGLNKALPMIDHLCSKPSVTQAELKQAHKLSMDGIMTILSNVTMPIQLKGGGKVWPPEDGGWYMATHEPYTYRVCPEFRTAWNAARGLA